jgi:multicomponent Na+:H+ antiporter subunit D
MNLLILPVVISLGASFIISLFFRNRDGLAKIASLVFASFSLLAVILLGPRVFEAERLIYYVGGWEIPLGITLMVDNLSWLFMITLNSISLLILIYSADYMKKYTSQSMFYVLFFLLIAGMNGILISADFFNLYVFLEIASLASYILVAFGLKAEELEASFRYTIMGIVGSLLIIFGIAFAYGISGTVNIPDFIKITRGEGKNLWFILSLFFSGFAIKMALMPFHAWLPDAHSKAPAPVSAVLSGLVIKILGLYAIVRLVGNVFPAVPEIRTVIITLGIISMYIGGFLALGQDDLKRVLAYSSISQLGYCAVGFGIGGYFAVLGFLLHSISHALSKSLLFLDVGVIEQTMGTTKISQLKGLTDKMPRTTLLGSLGMMAIIGIPPMGIFWSKLLIVLGALQKGYNGVAFSCILVSIITMGYFLKVQREIFFNKDSSDNKKREEKSFAMFFPMAILGISVLFIGLLLIPGIKEICLDKAVEVVNNFNYLELIGE